MSGTPPTDEALFLRYREHGDLESFGQLYDRYGAPLLRFLRRLIRDSGAAEDLTQHAFLRMHEARASFDPAPSFRTWAFTIARRLAINWIARQRHAAGCDIPETVDPMPTPEEHLLGLDAARTVERALSSLRREDVEILLLCKFEDLSYEQIGEIVGCSPDAAKMRVHRALRRLAARLP